MSSTTETARASHGAIHRSWRNYLLDAQFQLKYTGMVVGVTLVIASVLGFAAYRFSHSLSESVMVTMLTDPNVDPAFAASFEETLRDQDHKTALSIMGGIALLCLALGVTGIMVTHKVVGPAYKLQMLLSHLANGRLELVGRLRDGDELQGVFIALNDMVESWRKIQEEEIAALENGIDAARSAGVSETQMKPLLAVRDRMRAAL